MAADYPEHLFAREPAPPYAGDLLGRHARARIELRITPTIWPFWRQVAGSTVGFSGSRLSSAAPHPDRNG
jgi:uncharacterized protein DUF6886